MNEKIGRERYVGEFLSWRERGGQLGEGCAEVNVESGEKKWGKSMEEERILDDD